VLGEELVCICRAILGFVVKSPGSKGRGAAGREKDERREAMVRKQWPITNVFSKKTIGTERYWVFSPNCKKTWGFRARRTSPDLTSNVLL